ncbi:unnamed protein product [Linum tenue]|uniref:Uncharacterized protein n=1 Tax=Linum tenue TaxID=586396 RepID=A0AAV0LY71_9ROSI|nr:unnamed protein product [Linum tenue]
MSLELTRIVIPTRRYLHQPSDYINPQHLHHPSFHSQSNRFIRFNPLKSISPTSSSQGSNNVRPRQGRKRIGKGRRQEAQEGPPRQHPGHHQAGHPSSGSSWRRQAYQRPHLRGNPRRPQDLLGERDS